MNEEEAVEMLKRIDIKFFLSAMSEQSNYIVDEADKVNKAIETVLNLIQTKQEEIEILKCNNEILQGELDRIGVDTLKLEPGSSTDDVIEEIKRLKKKSMHYEKLITNGLASEQIAKLDEEMQATLRTELEKKDKIIDEMAEWISNRCFYKDDYSNICEVIQDSCYKETECKECVKEYFTKKVEE